MTFVEPYGPRISRAIMDRVQSSKFPLVTHPNGCYTVGEDCYAGRISSRTAPTTASWEVPLKNRQRDLREREEWLWVLYLKFDTEVNVEAFEASFEEDPPNIPRDAAHDHGVRILLESSQYTNPTQNQPGKGLEVVYRFDAVKTPA